MEQQDIRWKQRFLNSDKAFSRLDEGMRIITKEPDNFYYKPGLSRHTKIVHDIREYYFFLLKDLHIQLTSIS